MIKEMRPLSLAEAKEILENVDKGEEGAEEEFREEAEKYLKKFSSLKPDKAKEMREELENLEIIRLKEDHIVKIIDLLPEDMSDINKISPEISLEEDEEKKILDIVKKYK